MNKHLETLVLFKDGTKRLLQEQSFELLDAVKKIAYALFVLAWWLFALMLIILLPLATWIRLKAERDYEKAVLKAKHDYLDRMTCLHQKVDDSE